LDAGAAPAPGASAGGGGQSVAGLPSSSAGAATPSAGAGGTIESGAGTPGSPVPGAESAGTAPGAGAGGTASSPQTGASTEGAAAAQPAPELVAAVREEAKDFVPVAGVNDIFFDFDKFEIRSDARTALDANIDWLKTNAGYGVLIEGHCDERGTNEYNIALGEHRARATKQYLVANGVDAARIATVSYGKERPFCTERTEACWQLNRRSHFLVRQR
jgi:peptidoglycan-associated lipoprotein